MNWETYKLMTEKQKEEYNYKFDNKISNNIMQIVHTTNTIMMFFAFSMLIIYMGSKELLFSKELVSIFTICVLQTVIIYCILLLVYSLIYLFGLCWLWYKESKWLKDNKIVKIKSIKFLG